VAHRESLEGQMARRTTHRSTGGKKLYAVRTKEGKFKDIQSYKLAHGMDLKRKSKAETTAKKTVKKVAKKAIKKKAAKKK
jgi:16S rRNA U516 pseudouridylate synthase RsuA-like enzyme